MALRRELKEIVAGLLAEYAAAGEMSLDALGDAIGARAVTPAEIEAMIAALEASGLRVAVSAEASGEKHLEAALRAVRALTAELGRRPTLPEIRARAGLTVEQLQHALMLARVMQR